MENTTVIVEEKPIVFTKGDETFIWINMGSLAN